MKKKILSLLLGSVFAFSLISGCTNNNENVDSNPVDGSFEFTKENYPKNAKSTLTA